MKNTLNINESFICRIWESADEFCNGIRTTDGEPVKILNIGTCNSDSGPDFKNALIRIGDETYLGGHRDTQGS